MSHPLSRKSSRGFISLGLILVLIIAAALIGGGAYYAAKQAPATPPSQEVASTTPSENGQSKDNAPAENPSQPGTKQPATVASCEAFANIHRGDTDAKTNGQVSKLQAFLNISPTGSYGPLTEIGYTNKCVGGNAAPDSVAGMKKYTDSDFGFSFWYPSGWTVTRDADVRDVSTYLGGEILNTFKINGGGNNITIDEVRAISATSPFVTDASGGGLRRTCPTTACATVKYFFDSVAGQWQMVHPDEDTKVPAGVVQIADTSSNTMGGLHIFAGSARFGVDSIVPLSASKFLVITGTIAGNGTDQSYLVKTIVATDPTVAIPVSTAEQIKTIEAEKVAYGVGQPTTPSLSATPTSGPAPLTVTFITPPSAGGDYVSFGDGADGCSIPGVTNNGMTGCDVSGLKSFAHTYTKPGTYTVTVDRLLPSSILGTATITVR